MPKNKDQLSPHTRSQFERLVCEDGLGYCCPYALFRVTKDAEAIRLRLGISKRSAQQWKAKFKAKELSCEEQQNCMLKILRRSGK